MALRIKTDGTEEEVKGTDKDGALTLEEIRAAIGGGYIEEVRCRHGKFDLFFCDDEGMLKSLPINEKATEIWRSMLRQMLGTRAHLSSSIHGDVIFVRVDDDGESF